MMFAVVGIGLGFMALERLLPDQKLPQVKGWWARVVIVNALQLGVIVLGMSTWDTWFHAFHWLDLERRLPPVLAGLVSYFLLTFVFYWWHRARHDVNLLWLGLHQLHHSPQRIETITSFYKHPVEIICNSLLIGFVNHVVLGVGLEGAAWTLLYSSFGEYFYHMNVGTPRWVGWFFQRPEMHRIHHQRGKHYYNFSDLPVWDMLFGTYRNPPIYNGRCGFKPEREARFLPILAFRNVNDPMPRKGTR